MLTKREQIINEVWSAITHGVGVALAIAALVLLEIKAAGNHAPLQATVFAVYGVTLILLFLFSTLFHSLYFTRAARFFQILDHCSIYLLIVGTYTPYCLLAIPGLKGIVILIMIWSLGIGGALYHIIGNNRLQAIETLIYIGMGWLCLCGGRQLFQSLGMTGLLLLVSGGILYTVGAWIYSRKWGRYSHVLWHLFVLAGATSMFFSLYLYI